MAEVVIPFKTLRFSGDPEQEWGFNAVRRTRRTNEDSTWSPLPLRISSITRTSWAGTLTGLEGVRQGRNLKIKPFAIASASRPAPRRTRRRRRRGHRPEVRPHAVADARPDVSHRFLAGGSGRAAGEPHAVQLFFPEKREFFLENQGVFDIAATPGDRPNVIPFFSRRIGLSDDRHARSRWSAARGCRAAPASYDVGLLAMKTEDDGRAARPTTFVVGRVRRNLPNTSTVGAIFTSRDSTAPRRLQPAVRRRHAAALLRSAARCRQLPAGDRPPGQHADRNQARLLGAAWRDDWLTWAAQYEQVRSGLQSRSRVRAARRR